MPTFDEALAAKSALKAVLQAAGLRASCGVRKEGEGFAVKVNLPDASGVAKVPKSYEGIPVVVEVTGGVTTRAK